MLQKHYQLPWLNLFVLVIFFVLRSQTTTQLLSIYMLASFLSDNSLSDAIVLGTGILFYSASRVINIFIKKTTIINIVSDVISRVLCVYMQHMLYTLKPDLNNNTNYIHYVNNKQYLRLPRNNIKSVNEHH